jgi:dCTP deaminase
MAFDGILSDSEIRHSLNDKSIEIEPFNPEQVNPTSYDVTLGDQVAVYEQWVICAGGGDGGDFLPRPPESNAARSVLDVRATYEGVGNVKVFPITNEGWVIKPGIGYLMHTRERIHTNKYVPIIDGKSTIGRLFISIHETAGYGDPGFNGQFTLEVTCTHPVRLYAGMRIGQIRFHTIRGTVDRLYSTTGGYKGEQATGPQPSHFQRLFPRG